MLEYFHIIDPDSRRRAQLAREFNKRNYHAEIYESLEEFFGSKPRDGLIFAYHEASEETAPAEAVTTSDLPVVVYAEEPSTGEVVNALDAGAIDFMDWPPAPAELDSVLQRVVHKGERKLAHRRTVAEARAAIATLSPRERDVLLRLAQGEANKVMGQRLGISPRTIEIHRANMMRKLNAGSASAAVRIALLAGLEEDQQEAA